MAVRIPHGALPAKAAIRAVTRPALRRLGSARAMSVVGWGELEHPTKAMCIHGSDASGGVPKGTPPYTCYTATITVPETPRRRRSVRDMPVHHGPWDDSISLRREDMYGDDGR